MLRKYKHQQSVLNDLGNVLALLSEQSPLAEKYRDHNLKGLWNPRRECHIRPDVLLIYMTDDTTLYLERIGSHSELSR